MPQPDDRTAPARRPRHAAGRTSRTPGPAASPTAPVSGFPLSSAPISGAPRSSFPTSGAPISGAPAWGELIQAADTSRGGVPAATAAPAWATESTEERARHSRPETLADSNRLRPISAPPVTRRSADALFDPGQFEDSFIERGFPEVTRAQQRRSEAIRLAEERRTAVPAQTPAPATAAGWRRPDEEQARTREDAHTQGRRRADEEQARTREEAHAQGRRRADEEQARAREEARAEGRRRAEGKRRAKSQADQGAAIPAPVSPAGRSAPGPSAVSRLSQSLIGRGRRAPGQHALDEATGERRIVVPAQRHGQPADRGQDQTAPGHDKAVPRQDKAGRGQQTISRDHNQAARVGASELAAESRRGGGRGKHAAPTDLAITVRPLPAVRDAVVEGLPAAKRAAGSIREWALYTGDRPPAMGAHRAPGTLPVESWLLIGKSRQQALLATLVAVGLMLIVIPVQQRDGATSPVSSAGRAAATIAKGSKAKAPAGSTEHTAPATSAPHGKAKPGSQSSAPTGKAAPALKVPQGGGPASSLRTTGSKTVALTFDDGPDPVETPKILAMLADHGVKATFCLVGKQVERHPEIVRQIVAAGHTLCNHTWNHSLVIGKDKPEQIQADLKRTNDAIEAAAPGAAIPFFRAPGGNFTDRLVQVAYGDGMTSLYWQVDPQDWNHLEGEDDAAHVDRVVDGVKKHVKPGSIVLSHDFNQPDTIKAYEKLLPWLTENFELGLPPEEKPPASSAPAESPTETPAEPSAAPSEPAVAPSDQPDT